MQSYVSLPDIRYNFFGKKVEKKLLTKTCCPLISSFFPGEKTVSKSTYDSTNSNNINNNR